MSSLHGDSDALKNSAKSVAEGPVSCEAAGVCCTSERVVGDCSLGSAGG